MNMNIDLLTIHTIDELTKEFSLGKVLASPEDNSSGNTSFVISTTEGKFQVKGYKKSEYNIANYLPILQREIMFTKFLEQSGHNVPQHLGFQPFVFNGMLTTITKYMDFPQLLLSDINAEVMHAIGELTARFHLSSLAFGKSGAKQEQRNTFRENVYTNLDTILSVTGLAKAQIDPILEEYNSLRENFSSHFGALPSALVHSEITYVHLLQQEQAFSLIDFDGIRFSPLIFDFGQTILQHAFVRKDEFERDLVDAYFAGYQSVRTLSNQEKTAISTMLRYNYLHKIEWMLTMAVEHKNYADAVKKRVNTYDLFSKSINSFAL